LRFSIDFIINLAWKNKARPVIQLCNNINEGIRKLAAYSGGQMRGKKGSLLEGNCTDLIKYAWCEMLGQDSARLRIERKKISYAYRTDFGRIIRSPKIFAEKANQGIGPDVFVYIDDELVMVGESKAYCDITMFKRTFSEFESIHMLSRTVAFFIYQVENSLGGEVQKYPSASFSADQSAFSQGFKDLVFNKRTVNPNSNFDFNVLTLLNNKRDSDKEFSAKEKLAEEPRLIQILSYFKENLTKHARNS